MKKYSKAKVFLFMCLAFIIGIGAGSLAAIPFWLTYSFLISGVVLAIVFWPSQKTRLIGLCVLCIGLGLVRYGFSIPEITESSISYYNDQEVSFVGIVASEPDARSSHVKLTVEVIQGHDNLPEQITGRALVNAYLYPEYKYGDALLISCALQAPEPIVDELTGRVFDYGKYLARFNIYSLCYRPRIEHLASDQGNAIMSALLSVKNKFVQAIQLALPEPHASFLGGLILGAKKAIPDDLMESFNQTGTTHIVALSGYNITIIAVLIMNLCKHLWISRRGAFWVSLGAITFFVLITGAQASVLRAGIMGMLVLLATQLGRRSRITNTLVLAAVVMLAVNPKILVFDVGFQLSFLATIGLVYVSPLLEKLFKWVPSMFEIRASLVATLSATLMTLPLIVFQFGRLSIVAPLVNVLILPAIPIAMGVGFIAGVLTLIWLPLGQAFGWIVWVILSYIIFVVEKFGQLDFSSFDIGVVSWRWLVIGYLVICFLLFKLTKPKWPALSKS